MTFGELIHTEPAGQIEDRDMRRQLLVWRQRDAEHVHRFERLERRYRKRHGADSLPSINLPLAIRVEALERAIDARLTGRRMGY